MSAYKPIFTQSPRFFDKEVNNMHWIKVKWYWSNWIATCRQMKSDSYLSPCTNLISKSIKNPNLRRESLNLIEEEICNTLEIIGIHKDFLTRIPIAQELNSNN